MSGTRLRVAGGCKLGKSYEGKGGHTVSNANARQGSPHWARSIALLVATITHAALASAQPTQAQRGEYLARAGDCISCHTAQGGAPYAGGLKLDTPFGYMLAPNITPDPDTGIGRWSNADFYRALHDGVNKRGQDMYPTMPYDFYTRATRED